MNAIDKIAALNLNGLVRRAAMEKIGKETIMGILQERGAAKILAEKLGFANSGALSVATGDLGWREVSTRNGNGESETVKDETKTPHPVKRKISGFIPPQTLAWANRQIAAAFVAAGGDPDDVQDVDVTPSVFSEIPSFKMQRQGWIDHIKKMGGLDSEPMRALRAWLGVPLTAEQDELESKAIDTGKRKMRMKELAYNANRAHILMRELGIDTAIIENLVDLVARIGFIDDHGNLVV